MASVAAVLIVILGVINVINYSRINSEADRIIEMIERDEEGFLLGISPREGDELPEIRPEPPDSMEFGKGRGDEFPNGMSKETPFETRYFSVTVSSDGKVISKSLDRIAAINSEEAEELALAIYSSGEKSGFKGDYKFSVTDAGDSVKILFLDVQRSLSTFRNFLVTSTAVAAAGMLTVFILVFFISKIVTNPIAEGYEKQKMFITDASHELKTPLTIIDANTEVIEIESGENEWTEAIHHQVKRLASLTEDLVTLSRMEEDSIRHSFTDFSLSDALTESVELFKVAAEAAGKTIDLDVSRNVTLNGDEKSIRKLFGILCDNALKYSSEDGGIKVSLSYRDRPVIVFSNKAEGVGKGNHDILFERFYRSDKSRNSKTGGYGIGLSVARAIMEAHKGRITAESPDGNTLVFTLTF